MKATSQVVMGATLVMAASLAVVLALILVLLVELYCSLLLRRCRRLQSPKPITAIPPASTAIVKVGASKPLGVLDAPRSVLLPSLSPIKKELLAITSTQDQNPSSTPPHRLGLLPAPTSPALTPLSYSYPKDKHLVYISNPIYEDGSKEKPLRTPFETPHTLQSRMESTGGSSSSDHGEIEVMLTRQVSSLQVKRPPLPVTPSLSPMRKLNLHLQLQLQPSSFSLYTSGSGYSNSNNGIFSSTPGTTPCTSPSC